MHRFSLSAGREMDITLATRVSSTLIVIILNVLFHIQYIDILLYQIWYLINYYQPSCSCHIFDLATNEACIVCIE